MMTVLVLISAAVLAVVIGYATMAVKHDKLRKKMTESWHGEEFDDFMQEWRSKHPRIQD